VLSTTAHAAADAPSVRHSLLPSWGSIAPSDLRGRTFNAKLARNARRDREAVAANEAKATDADDTSPIGRGRRSPRRGEVK
jgi:hypothetical protein